MMTAPRLNVVTASRLRLTQRLLVAASDLDPQLLKDEHWQKAMLHVAQLLARDSSCRALRLNVARELDRFDVTLDTVRGLSEGACRARAGKSSAVSVSL